MKTEFCCDVCKRNITHESEISTGYGKDKEGNKICFDCCGYEDKAYMIQEGRIDLYLAKNEYGKYEVHNWPATLKIPCWVNKGSHNIAGSRYDAHFWFNQKVWHGVNYGENSQILHCRVTKRKMV